MMGMLEEIGTFLEGQGIGTQQTDIFLGDVPQNAPDAVVGIIETSGLAPVYVHDITGPAHNQPTFQIYTRALTYAAARLKAKDVFEILGKLQNVALSGTFYQTVRPRQNPFSLGRDDKNRSQISCNYEAVKVPSI